MGIKYIMLSLSLMISSNALASDVFDVAKDYNISAEKISKYVQNKLPNYTANDQVKACTDVYDKDPESVTYALFNIILFFEILDKPAESTLKELRRKKYLAQYTSISLRYCAML